MVSERRAKQPVTSVAPARELSQAESLDDLGTVARPEEWLEVALVARHLPTAIVRAKLEAAADLSEVVQEGQHRQPRESHFVQSATAGSLGEPSSQHRLLDQGLEACRHIGAVVLKAVRVTVSVAFSPRKGRNVHFDVQYVM